MASTSCNDLAGQLLACCLESGCWPDDLLDKLLAPECADALFRVVIERLADLFDPRLCDVYAEMFSQVIARSVPELKARDLVARYRRIRRPRRFEGDAATIETVFVLSRVTLGADVAITSVLLDAARQRFPRARIVLVGSRKSWELFAGRGIEHAPVSCLRTGSMRERLAPWTELARLLTQPDSIVIDPDSRLTQLGLLPVCPEENYYFFESRAYGSEGDDPLPVLAARWAHETFGVEQTLPWIAPAEKTAIPGTPLITMSFGVGENPAKRCSDPFEEQLVAHVAERGAFVLIDQGAGGEEAGRVAKAIAASGAPPERVRSFCGSFSGFASAIAQSDLYIGYDSAGQHVAAACGIPLISIFAGFPSDRFCTRWRPWARGKTDVIKATATDPPAAVLHEVLNRLTRW
ncbi:MAG TPA: glycosyltransferase family 9 protein [Bryobacteraceae bacterium]|nr:glycosyltransferase family 9 protein [Bryobacteraceae bacterium]